MSSHVTKKYQTAITLAIAQLDYNLLNRTMGVRASRQAFSATPIPKGRTPERRKKCEIRRTGSALLAAQSGSHMT
jgi:hypothetical protein